MYWGVCVQVQHHQQRLTGPECLIRVLLHLHQRNTPYSGQPTPCPLAAHWPPSACQPPCNHKLWLTAPNRSQLLTALAAMTVWMMNDHGSCTVCAPAKYCLFSASLGTCHTAWSVMLCMEVVIVMLIMVLFCRRVMQGYAWTALSMRLE